MTAGSVAQHVIAQAAVTEALEAAVSHAEAIGARINVAIVDSGGNLAGFLRMPGAFLLSIDLAIRKARSSAGTGLSPEAADAVLAQEAARVREGLVADRGFVPIHGSFPLFDAGSMVGAIGVSGGAEAEDIACCRAAIECLSMRYAISDTA